MRRSTPAAKKRADAHSDANSQIITTSVMGSMAANTAELFKVHEVLLRDYHALRDTHQRLVDAHSVAESELANEKKTAASLRRRVTTKATSPSVDVVVKEMAFPQYSPDRDLWGPAGAQQHAFAKKCLEVHAATGKTAIMWHHAPQPAQSLKTSS